MARAITEAGHIAEHVADVGLLHAPDTAIWNYAESMGAVLITKDEDFAARHQRGQKAVCIVWLRFGNVSRPALIQRLLPLLPMIETMLANGDVLIEIR